MVDESIHVCDRFLSPAASSKEQHRAIGDMILSAFRLVFRRVASAIRCGYTICFYWCKNGFVNVNSANIFLARGDAIVDCPAPAGQSRERCIAVRRCGLNWELCILMRD